MGKGAAGNIVFERIYKENNPQANKRKRKKRREGNANREPPDFSTWRNTSLSYSTTLRAETIKLTGSLLRSRSTCMAMCVRE